MKIIFNTFRLISSKISQDYLQRYVVHMLPSLYKVCEGFAGKNIPGEFCRSHLRVLVRMICSLTYVVNHRRKFS